MRRLIILTERYEKILQTYLHTGDEREWIIRSKRHGGKFFYMHIFYRPGGNFAEALTAVLEEAAARENLAYAEFPDLMKTVRDLRGTPVSQENERRLAEFLAENAALNVEGYAAFRMTDYNFKLDLTAYGFIKQMLYKQRVTEH